MRRQSKVEPSAKRAVRKPTINIGSAGSKSPRGKSVKTTRKRTARRSSRALLDDENGVALAGTPSTLGSRAEQAAHYAAIDLGSNSFHMLIARVMGNDVRILDRIREPVRLAQGLRADGSLDEAARERALDCLHRFGQRIRGFPTDHVRAVGTSTFRRAKDEEKFLATAQEALGHDIEVIPDVEEARLIYLGVMCNSEDAQGRRLVVDIGGGSTECILGEQLETLEANSFHMGCVSYSRQFFVDGALTRKSFRDAELAAHLELHVVDRRYRALGWDVCYGASGTIKAVEEILRLNGWSHGGIDLRGLKKLRRAMVEAKHVDRLSLPGLQPDRAPVLAGGLSILKAIVERLKITTMQPASGALREGLLYDMYGRVHRSDVRERTIRIMCERYGVDPAHGSRVERTALTLLGQVAKRWELTGDLMHQRLAWAARLHELGLAVAYGGYHKHGAYLVANASTPGFSREEKLFLAALIRAHRRKIQPDMFAEVPRGAAMAAVRLCTILRVAVLLHRGRRPAPPPDLRLRVEDNTLRLDFPKAWLHEHPLTAADLAMERSYLRALGLRLRIHEH